jgi:hypothetical protein
MSRDNSLPFPRGEYEATAGAFDHLLGREYQVEDIDWGSTAGQKPHRSGKMVTVRLVRNDSGGVLLPKRLAMFSEAAGEYGGVVDRYVATLAARGYPVDEFLPAAGVPDGAYFYIVVKGPATVVTPDTTTAFNGDISIGEAIVAASTGATNNTTGGRAAAQVTTGATDTSSYDFAINAAMNVVGRALEGLTADAANTAKGLLVEVGKW